EIGMGRPRVAVDAAVLAAAIRIDRLRERDVWRLVAGDDRARCVDRYRGLDRRRLLRLLIERAPAVVDPNPGLRLEAAVRIGDGAAPLAGLVGQGVDHAPTLRRPENNSRTNDQSAKLRQILSNSAWCRSNRRSSAGSKCATGAVRPSPSRMIRRASSWLKPVL